MANLGYDKKIITDHIEAGLENLIRDEQQQIFKINASLDVLVMQHNEMLKQSITNFKWRIALCVITTLAIGGYLCATLDFSAMTYQSLKFYFVVIVCIGWLVLLRYLLQYKYPTHSTLIQSLEEILKQQKENIEWVKIIDADFQRLKKEV